MTRRQKTIAPRESLIQQAVIEHWRMFGVPGSLVAAVPNARAFGQAGLTPGLFDLVVLSPKLGDRTGWLELKREPREASLATSRKYLRKAQQAFKHLLIARGVPYAVAHGRDEPIEVLEEWGAVRPARAAA